MGRSRVLHDAPIRILVTGGTFDKDYLELEGRLHIRDTHVPEMLKLGCSRLPIVVETLMLIDSLGRTDEHRAQALESCRRAREERRVITHGTGTMAAPARTVGAARLPKTIVLT